MWVVPAPPRALVTTQLVSRWRKLVGVEQKAHDRSHHHAQSHLRALQPVDSQHPPRSSK